MVRVRHRQGTVTSIVINNTGVSHSVINNSVVNRAVNNRSVVTGSVLFADHAAVGKNTPTRGHVDRHVHILEESAVVGHVRGDVDGREVVYSEVVGVPSYGGGVSYWVERRHCGRGDY